MLEAEGCIPQSSSPYIKTVLTNESALSISVQPMKVLPSHMNPYAIFSCQEAYSHSSGSR